MKERKSLIVVLLFFIALLLVVNSMSYGMGCKIGSKTYPFADEVDCPSGVIEVTPETKITFDSGLAGPNVAVLWFCINSQLPNPFDPDGRFVCYGTSPSDYMHGKITLSNFLERYEGNGPYFTNATNIGLTARSYDCSPPEQDGCSAKGSSSISLQLKAKCISVGDLYAPSTIYPELGQVANIRQSVGKNYNFQQFDWAVGVGDRSYAGANTDVNVTWDGKDSNGQMLPSGEYLANVIVRPQDSTCPVLEKAVSIKVFRCPHIINFTSSSTSFAPSGGNNTITFLGQIDKSTGPIERWNLSIAGRNFNGNDNSIFETWDGKDDQGNTVAPGEYAATLVVNPGSPCAETKTINITVLPFCQIGINNFSADKAVINPNSGEEANFTGSVDISGNVPSTYYWDISIAGRTISGYSTPSLAWNGKDSLGALMPDGSYSALLTVWSDEGSCSASASTEIEVKNSDDDCELEVPWASTANVATGKVTHKQDLLSLKGGSLGTDVSLYYNSLAPRSGPINTTMIKHYQKSLQVQNDGSVLYRGWDVNTTYLVSANGYQSPSGDTSGLLKMDDGSFELTEADGTVNRFDQTGKIVLAKEASGDSYRFAYGNDTIRVTDPQNRTTTFSQFVYNSINPMTGVLSHGWSHSYQIALQDQGNGVILFHDGASSRRYTRVGDTYLAPPGDKSIFTKNSDNTYTVQERIGIQHNFDQWGRITSRKDHNGVSMSFNYSGGNLSAVVDGAGRTTTFAYDTSGRLTSIVDPKGNSYSFAYEGEHLASVAHPDGGRWNYSYDDDGFLLTKSDPEGNITTYSYGPDHQVMTATDPQGKVRSLGYMEEAEGATKASTFKEKDGGNWTYTYDTSTGTLTSKTDPYGEITSYLYDRHKNLYAKIEPKIGTTTYLYDADNNLVQVINPLHQMTTYNYNGRGQILSVTATDGGTTTSTYDDHGNLISVTDPVGTTTSYEYDSFGHLASITNDKGKKTKFTYNSENFVASMTDPAGATNSFTYDLNGNVLTSTNDSGKITRYEYDNMNRLTGSTDPLGNKTSFGYDRLGNRTSVTDANGKRTTFSYNYLHQVTETQDPEGHVTTFSYGSTGCPSCGGATDKLAAITDAKKQTTTFAYDLLGRLIKETDPLGQVTTYGYSQVLNMILKGYPNGTYVGASYDSLNRLTSKMYENFSYDAGGRILTASYNHIDNTMNYSYGYDPVGRVTSITDSRGYTIAYEYDNLGNRTRMILQPGTADERATSYSYDDNNRLLEVTSAAGTFSYVYDNLGRRKALSYPNQVAATYTFDDADRLQNLVYQTADHASIAAFSYSRDNVGNVVSKAATELETYVYDSLYRLLTVTSSRPEVFSLDVVGNRQNGPGAKDGSYRYDAANRNLQGRKFHYEYDNNGNQTSRVIPKATNVLWTQSWDFDNRLAKVEKVSGNEKRVVSFKYDPFGRRIEKKVMATDDGETTTETYTYIYDNNDIILEIFTDAEGAETRTYYTHGSNTDEHLSLERNGRFFYYHSDGLGSIVSITDSGAAVVQTHEYDSYGMVKPSTSFRSSYTYTGREWDKETGLYYYRARYYDPMEGRFISKDPIGYSGGINVYVYAENNSINRTDPDGQSPLDIIKDGSKLWEKARQCKEQVDVCKEKHKDVGKCSERGEDIKSPYASAHLFNECYNKISVCNSIPPALFDLYSGFWGKYKDVRDWLLKEGK